MPRTLFWKDGWCLKVKWLQGLKEEVLLKPYESEIKWSLGGSLQTETSSLYPHNTRLRRTYAMLSLYPEGILKGNNGTSILYKRYYTRDAFKSENQKSNLN